MWSNHHSKNHTIPARMFSTPPASWNSQPHSPAVVMALSERKSNCVRRDLFHVVHKVPSGDSPYVRAKHVQLIDKDPGKAIALFWAAINARDRVDSALKDMAIVMKQLDRSDEAIEAIKSFRHLCTYESHESLDNVLVELYKRSGRIEEEIDMLQRKLKNIEEGVAFGGKRTKTARSQGKKVQITIEQEKSRVLGNLAWAHMQHHDYGLAEQHYRKALSLEPDYNKQCNLALCLMHMNRIPEAKSLLQAISASCGSKGMDESYAKSFERAVEMLNNLESRSQLKTVDENRESQRPLAIPATVGSVDSRRWRNGENKEPAVSEKYTRSSYLEDHSENHTSFFDHRKDGIRCMSSVLRRGSGTYKKLVTSPETVLYTQPRSSWRFSEGGQTAFRCSGTSIQDLDGDLQESTDYKPEATLLKPHNGLVSPVDRNWRERPDMEFSRAKNTGNQVISAKEEQIVFVDEPEKVRPTDSAVKSAGKSWADMVEEEERDLSNGEMSRYFDTWTYETERTDENLNSNIDHRSACNSPTDTVKIEAFDLRDGHGAFSSGSSPRNPTVRRSLCFDAKKDSPVRRKNRLQVFRDITPTPDSP